MKNFYLLPIRVSLPLCLIFSSSFVFGQKVTEIKTSLQSSKVRPPLSIMKSGSADHHRKDASLKTDYRDAGVKLDGTNSSSEQSKELRSNVTATISTNEMNLLGEKAQTKKSKKFPEIKEFPVKNNSAN